MVRRTGALTAAARRPGSLPPFKPGSFRSRLHDESVATWLGLALAVTFSVCFATGLLSHLIQQPPSWFTWPTRPAGLYRVTQGLHVVSGLASVPLLFIKLFVVYPHLWTWPPVRGVRHAVERAGLAALVGGSLFLLVTGVQNVTYWYPWGFFFPPAHYWAAWITVGALVVHVGAKAGITRRVLTGDAPIAEPLAELRAGGLSRRGVLGLAAGAVTLVVTTTAGATLRPLERLALLAPRRPSVGPQGFPVNRTSAGAGVQDTATDPQWRLHVAGRVTRELSLSLEDLQRLPQREAVLPIACVEGWSASKRWGGVAVADLLDEAGAPAGAAVRVDSLEPAGLYRSCTLHPGQAADPATLLALRVEDEPLHLEHGFPCRLMTPNNPGVRQTKWVATVTVLG